MCLFNISLCVKRKKGTFNYIKLQSYIEKPLFVFLENHKIVILNLFYYKNMCDICHDFASGRVTKFYRNPTRNYWIGFSFFFFAVPIRIGIRIESSNQILSKPDPDRVFIKPEYPTRCKIPIRILTASKNKKNPTDTIRSDRIPVKSSHPTRCRILIQILPTEKEQPTK